jgi:plastocyanin
MRTRLLALVAATTLILASACSDDDGETTAVDPTDPPAGAAEPDPDPDTGAPGEGAGDAAGDEAVVDVSMSFEPATVEISAGTTVRWQSAGGLPHTVTSTSGPTDFDEALPDGGSVRVTFDEPGTYEYVCSIHPDMAGTVVVS